MIEIFIPFWGDVGYLRDAVQSVLDQSDPEWQLVVVDDCYPDLAVAEYFDELDDLRVRYIRNETNLGITGNYRRCLELASAEWMVFLGCDDMLLPAYVATVRDALSSSGTGVDVVQPGVRVIDEHGTTTRPVVDRVKKRLFRPSVDGRKTLGGEDLAVSLLRGNWTYWPSLVFRVEAVRRQQFLDGFPLIQDLALLVDLTLAGSRMTVLDEEVFAYRRHSASASSLTVSDGGRFRGEREYFEIAARRCADAGWMRAARAARLHPASRLYAASELPRAVRTGSWSAVQTLATHLVRR